MNLSHACAPPADPMYSQSRMTKDRNAEQVEGAIKEKLEHGEPPSKEEAK